MSKHLTIMEMSWFNMSPKL